MGETAKSLTVLILDGIAIGAVGSVITLGLLYAGLPFFGPVNDLTNALVGLFIGLLAWQFFASLPTKAAPDILIMLVCWAGAILIIWNSLLVAFGRMDWKLGGLYTGVGYGLIGIWLLLTLITSSLAGDFPSQIHWVGFVVGIGLVIGLAAGFILAGKLSIRFQPLVWLVYALTALGWIGFPIWCWMLSRRLL